MNEHTPAPWNDDLDIYLDAAFKVAKGEDQWKWPPRRIEDNEIEANARVMKAAPDLLAALEVWAQYAENNGWTDADHHGGDPAANGWITMTRTALARAKGRP